MKNKTLLIVLGGLSLVAACLLAYLCRPSAAAKMTDGGAKTISGMPEMRAVIREHAQKNGSEARSVRKRRRGEEIVALTLRRSMFDDLPEAERKLCEAVQEALDAEDFKKTIDAVSQSMLSKNPEVRSHAVEALGWFGAEALPELTTLMGDPDEDVAQSAINAWESGISEIDDAKVRFKVAGMALRALSGEDALQSIGSQYSIAATELIDSAESEEAALDMRVMVIQAVVDMIDSANKRLSDLGCELYEDITGNEWLNVTEAEKYLNDPDNYEPPEETGEIRVEDVSQAEDVSLGEATKEAEAKDESAVVDEPDPDEAAVVEPEGDQVEPDS